MTASSSMLQLSLSRLRSNDPLLVWTTLDLYQNSIGDSEASALATALQHNSSLSSLNLQKNFIGDSGASALARVLQHNSSLTTLDLTFNKIGDAGANALATTLEHNSTLTSLFLSRNKIGASGASALARALQHNSSLTFLDLSTNSLGDSEASSLGTALHHNSTLTNLNLYNNRIGDSGTSALAIALQHNSSLTTLNLRSNWIGASGASALATALRHNSSLTTLHLDSNKCCDSGAIALAEALPHNSSLITLDLLGNGIGESGAVALATALQHNSSLISLDLRKNSFYCSGANALARALQHNSSLTSLFLSDSLIGDSAALKRISVKLNLNKCTPKRPVIAHASQAANPSSYSVSSTTYLQRAFPWTPDSATIPRLQATEQTLLQERETTAKLRAELDALKAQKERNEQQYSEDTKKLARSFDQLEALLKINGLLQAQLKAERETSEQEAQRLLAESEAKHRTELDAMKARQEQTATAEAEKFAQLQAELEAMKSKLSHSPRSHTTDFLSRLLITTLDELEVEEPYFAAGSYGNVHRGNYHGQRVAVKRLNWSSELELLVKELKMWSRLMHPNVVQLMGYTEPPLPPMIVMELMEGSLFHTLQNKDVSLNLLLRVKMAHDLASGVSYLHYHQGVHRDIKSLNVLVRGTEIKLADFGTTRGLVSMSLTTSGSMRWNAPEVFEGEAASQASDVYALGVTFSEIFTRGLPYADLIADAAVMRAVFKGTRPQLWPPTAGMQELLIGGGDLEKQTEGFRQLIQKCWDEIPAKRPAAREVRVELASLLSQMKGGFSIPSPAASSERANLMTLYPRSSPSPG